MTTKAPIFVKDIDGFGWGGLYNAIEREKSSSWPDAHPHTSVLCLGNYHNEITAPKRPHLLVGDLRENEVCRTITIPYRKSRLTHC